jgi:hypothetical protein
MGTHPEDLRMIREHSPWLWNLISDWNTPIEAREQWFTFRSEIEKEVLHHEIGYVFVRRADKLGARIMTITVKEGETLGEIIRNIRPLLAKNERVVAMATKQTCDDLTVLTVYRTSSRSFAEIIDDTLTRQ